MSADFNFLKVQRKKRKTHFMANNKDYTWERKYGLDIYKNKRFKQSLKKKRWPPKGICEI